MTMAGKIEIRFNPESGMFRHVGPVKIRDSKMRLVKRVEEYDSNKLELSEGLYEISVLLGDGNAQRKLVQVTKGDNAPIILGGETTTPIPESAKIARVQADRSQVKLLEVRGAKETSHEGQDWFFTSEPDLQAVPSALMEISGQRIIVSLPVSPENGKVKNDCVVTVGMNNGQETARARFSDKRKMARTLQNMLEGRYLLQAADVAYEAVDLFRYKYSDPTGAALGALLLQKVGLLKKKMDWLENLARDFSWLPDGKILLARILYENKDTKVQAIEMAVTASKQRILYSESYSLLLKLLRRIIRDYKRNDVRSVISELAAVTPNIIWDSIFLTHTIGE